MQKVTEWINNHQEEFTKRRKNSNKIKINWKQEHKIINNLKKEHYQKYQQHKNFKK